MVILFQIWYNTNIFSWTKIFLISLFALLLLPSIAAAAEKGVLSFLQTEGEGARIIPILQTEEGERLELRGLESAAPGIEQSGARKVIVYGDRADDAFRVSDIKIGPLARSSPEKYSEKEGGLMLVNVSWTNAPSSYTFRSEDYQYLRDWSREASRGQWRWNPVTVLNLAIPKESSCSDEEDFVREVRRELLDKDYPLYSDYRALAIVLPDPVFRKCGYAPGAGGYAYLGSWLNRYDLSSGLSVYNSKYTKGTWKRLLLHELGHTLGAGHAYTLSCSNGSLNYEQVIEEEEHHKERACVPIEYGDPWDVMGSYNPRELAFSPPTYAPGSSRAMGWIGASEIKSIPLDGEMHKTILPAYDLPGAKQRVLRIQLPGRDYLLRGRSPGWLWIDYRDSIALGEIFFSGDNYGDYDWPFGKPLAQTLILRFEPSIAMTDAFDLWAPFYNFPVSHPRHPDEWYECEYENPCQSWNRRFGIRPYVEWKDPFGDLSIYFRETTSQGAEVVIQTPFFREPQRAKIRFLETPRRITKARSARFRFQVSDADEVICRLDRERPAPCAGGVFRKKGLLPGSHRLLIRAKNKLGISRAAHSWYIRKR